MKRKRFVVEIGTGIDLHGEDVTKAACRAVRDAISRSCLCGLVEIPGAKNFHDVDVEIVIASPWPDAIDCKEVEGVVPIGRKTVRVVNGGMVATGLCVPDFAPASDRIVVANAAITVFLTSDTGFHD